MSQDSSQFSLLTIDKSIASKSKCLIEGVIHKKSSLIEFEGKQAKRYDHLLVDQTGE